MQMNKERLKSVIVLSIICLVVAILLSSINAITAPIIEKAASNAAASAYGSVLPEATELEEISGEFPETVKKALKDKGGKGFVFELSTKNGYTKKEINMVLGIGADGLITKLDITSYPESKGSAEVFETLFSGKDASTNDIISGATISSNAIKSAIKDAYDVYYKYAGVEKTDEQKLADLYDVLMPEGKDKSGAYSFASVQIPEGASDSITSILAPKTNIGYIVTAKAKNMSVAMAINAYGKVYAIYDLDGNDLSGSAEYDSIKQDVQNAIPSIYETNNQTILDLLISKEIISSNKDAEKVDFGSVSSRVVAVYSLKNGNAYIANADGYGGVLTVCYVINSKGEIVDYATLKQSEISNEYSGLDFGTVISFGSYKDRFKDKTVSTFGDEDLLIAGSSFTTAATQTCWKSVKEAFEIMNGEGVK